ncbi:MAG: four helix bundle protein [Candidatus Peribacteraceae bacterium]|jgi:four helix bundle protein|nr:four helix bundle protein [Candidatus Peribacteraceae bacterium]
MTRFHEDLKFKMDEFVHFVYDCTRKFPREELYGVTSQLRRAALSVILNYIEGYARGRDKVHKNFLEISYGSLKESKYLLEFSLVERYLQQPDYEKAMKLSEEIGAMLWGMLRNMKHET